MQKLKKVFSPGNDKDDEMMYGTPRKSADNSHSQSDTVGRSSSGSATNQSPTSPSQTKEHGTTRQVISPDADKYDEQRFGKSASGTEPQSSKAANDREALLASQSAQEDKSVKRQVLHPESNKHDETGFGTTGFTGKDAQDTKAPSSRPNELGSVPPSNDRYTSETTAAPGSAFTTDRQAMPPTTDSRMSMKSGVVGSADQRTTDRALGSDGITDDGTSAPKQDQSSSNFSRNAALAGAGAAAGAGGAYAATRQRRTSRTSGDPEIEEATYTDRSFPLRGGTNSSHLQEDRPASSVYSNDAAGPSSTSAYIDPSTSSSTQKDAGGLGYGSGSAAVAGAGAGAVGAAATKEKLADHSKHSHVFHGDPCKDGPHSPADKTLPYVPGPHNTVAANLEDPHVPGEFPSEDGTDPHGNHGAGGFSRSSQQQQQQQQTPLLASTRPNVGSQSSYPMQTSPSEKSSNDHHTALAAGGAGAAGLGAYAATRDRGKPTEQTTSRDVASSTQQPQTSSAAHTQTPQQVAGDPVTGAREPEKEHQYGRNAAYAGGAGAAGAAAYTAYQRSQDRDGAVPSSQDPVSRDSNVGGLGDTQRRDVTDSTAPKDEKEHHYGRNAGLAGATGAAGYGAYQYGKDRGDNNVSSKADDPYDTYRDAADPKTQPETTRHAAPTETRTAAPTKTEQYTTQQPQSQPQKQVSPQQEEHHYGRNAALAGGAGAAGAAGYSALQSDRGDTGPASKTIGPHESNVANILDPRVRPEPEKMKDHTTAGPWQSDTLNKLDPKVESNPEKADVKAHGYASGVAPQSMSQQQQQRAAPGEEDKDHHYGRNAALAGGAAGAGAAAGYGASQAYEQRTQPEGLSEKEQEKLAKQQEKQAQHDAKQRAHEQEKQAKHDAKEQQKQAKHEADEAAKAQKKEQEKAAKEAEKEREKKAKEVEKEQKKADKQHAKEEEKAEKARAKDAERAEKEHAKEQEKLDKERESEDSALAAARQEEAERKHHEHNKLHKTPPEEREKKGGILHRIFHHKAHDREGVEGGERQSGSFEEGERAGGLEGDETGRARGAAALDGSGGAGGDSLGELRQGDKVGEGFGQQGGSRDSGIVTEKSTGLPMNVGKYGSGAGGTDAGEHIHGYQGEAR